MEEVKSKYVIHSVHLKRTKWDDWQAGFASFLIVLSVISILTSIGDTMEASVFHWYDALKLFAIIAIYSHCVIQVYRFLKDIGTRIR